MSNFTSSGDSIFGDKVFGDSYIVHEGIGKVEYWGSGGNITGVSKAEGQGTQESIDLQRALNHLSDAVRDLRSRLDEQDRVILDQSVQAIRDRGDQPGVLRRAFYSIAGIAAVVTDASGIVDAIRQVIGAINS